MMTRWYIVFKGRVPGVYDKWEDCFKQVNKFKGNNYKGFKTREEAEARYRNY
jgi:ribonuclease HI